MTNRAFQDRQDQDDQSDRDSGDSDGTKSNQGVPVPLLGGRVRGGRRVFPR